MKLNATLMKSTVVAALGGLLFGFDTAVISGTTGALTQTYSLTPFLLGVTVFSALCGTVLGAMLALTIAIGLLAGRDVFKETPMTALRDV